MGWTMCPYCLAVIGDSPVALEAHQKTCTVAPLQELVENLERFGPAFHNELMDALSKKQLLELPRFYLQLYPKMEQPALNAKQTKEVIVASLVTWAIQNRSIGRVRTCIEKMREELLEEFNALKTGRKPEPKEVWYIRGKRVVL